MKKMIFLMFSFIFIFSIAYAEDNMTYYGLSGGESVISNIDFNDLKNLSSDYWAKPSIYEMSALGIMNGFPDKTFKPELPLTNEQAVVLILNAMGKEAEVKAANNKGLKDTWSDSYIRYAINNGVITEKIVMKKSDIKSTVNIDALKKSGVFIKDNVITREEAAKLISSALKLSATKDDLDFFDKSNIDEAYMPYVKAVTEANIMNGTEGKMFSPKSGLRREEIAQILMNAENHILDKMTVFKRKGLVEGISDTSIKIIEESGEEIIIDINNKNIPIYRNGSIGGKEFLGGSEDIEYYFNVSKEVKFIKVSDDSVSNINDEILKPQNSKQGIVVGNSPYFSQITVKDKEGNSQVYSYGSWTEFYKEGKEASSSEIIQGDTVYIEFDEVGDVITIRGVSNYKITYSTVTKVDGYNIDVKSDLGKLERYSLKNIPVYKNGRETIYSNIKNGDYIKLYNSDMSISKIEIVPDERQLENIYKGVISEINLIQDKIILKNAEKYEKGSWKRADIGFLSIPLDKDIFVTFYSEIISKEDLGEFQLGKYAYIATRKDTREIEKAKSIRIGTYRSEKVYIANVKSYDEGDRELKIDKISNNIYIDDSTILIDNGKIVENVSPIKNQKVYITSSKVDGIYTANVIEVSSYEDDTQIEIYEGTIYDIEENEEVTLKVTSKFVDNEWYDVREKLASFNITYNTRIISENGPINVREFSIEENEEYEDAKVYIVANGNDIIELSLIDLGEDPLIIKGKISSINDVNIDISDLEYYDFEEEEWTDGDNEEITIAAGTIIIRNGQVIKQKDIEADQEILVIKSNDASISNAGIIIIQN